MEWWMDIRLWWAGRANPEFVSRPSLTVSGFGHSRLGAMTMAKLAAVILFCSLLSARRAKNFIRYLLTQTDNSISFLNAMVWYGIIIIKNVKIRVTLSWVTLQGDFTELLKSQTKWSAAGEWSQCHASVSSNSHVFKRLRKERSDGASLTAGGRLFLPREMRGRRVQMAERRVLWMRWTSCVLRCVSLIYAEGCTWRSAVCTRIHMQFFIRFDGVVS